MKIIPFVLVSFLFLLLGCHPPALSQKSPLTVVADGKPNGIIVVSASAPKYIMEAAMDLQKHLELSSGATVPIVTDNETGKIKNSGVKLAVGTSNFTEGKISVSGLKFEEFSIKTDLASQTIYMVANDGADNPATHWAVCEFLERAVGAKWLWPGELGTFVTKKSTIIAPEINVHWVSPYEFRMFKKNASNEVKAWLVHHRIARTREFQENSNNHGWYEKYYDKYPEIFARTPDGKPYTNQWAVKLPKFRLDSQKFFDLMMEDYISKGRPAIYALFPTDGISFDALSVPGKDPVQVYRGQVPITKQYLDFYKKFDQAVNGKKAVTRFDILAYSAYYYFPDNYSFDGKNFNVWFVDRTNDRENWKKWAATGAKMYLRPNWWNRASFGPDMSYKTNGDMLNFCQKSGIAGVKIDGFKDNWSLQGLNYYVMARQLYSSKNVDEIVAEYTSAFGNGAPEVAEYFQLCTTNSAKFSKEMVASMAEEMELSDDVNLTSVEAIPGLFPQNLRNQMAVLLDKAAQSTSGIERKRVDWLKAGLTVTDMVCDYVNETKQNQGQPPNSEAALKKVKEIEEKYPYAITSKSFESVMKKKFKPENKNKGPKKK